MLNKDVLYQMNYNQLKGLKENLEKENGSQKEKDMVDEFLSDFLDYIAKYGDEIKNHPYGNAKHFYKLEYDEIPPMNRGLRDVSRLTTSNMIPMESILNQCLIKIINQLPMYYDMIINNGGFGRDLDEIYDAIEANELDIVYDGILNFFVNHIDDKIDYEKEFCMLLVKETLIPLHNTIATFNRAKYSFEEGSKVSTDKFVLNHLIANAYNFTIDGMNYEQRINATGFLDSLYRNPKTRIPKEKVTIAVNHGDHQHLEEIPVYRKVNNNED